MADDGDRDGAPVGKTAASFHWRSVASRKRVLIGWSDVAMVAWLCIGVIVAPLPRSARWRLCFFFALLSGWTSRARAGRQRMARMVGLSAVEASGAISTLYAGRFAGYLDVVRGLLLAPDVRFACRGLEHIEAAKAQGRGALLWVSDFVSAGDVSKMALAQAGYPLVHLSRPEHGFTTSRFGIRFLNPLRIKFECAYLRERVIFDRANPSVASARLLEVLRTGGPLSVMASSHEGRALVVLPFMGGRIKLAAGALRLARKAGAVVIPVFVVREQGMFEVRLEAPLPLAGDLPEADAVLAAASEYGRRLEAMVLQHPEAWVGWRRADQVAVA
jgi:lauroyl/myristoyl acyltransferase